jgi:hypothetical protein
MRAYLTTTIQAAEEVLRDGFKDGSILCRTPEGMKSFPGSGSPTAH